MSLYQDLETLIRSHVSLSRPNGLGFEQCKCRDCDDYKDRGAFKFDGYVIGYNCFNCGLKLKFDSVEHKRPSKRFISLLVSFGAQEDVIKALVAKNIIASGSLAKPIPGQMTAKEATEEIERWAPPKTIDTPSGWVPIESDASPWSLVAREYLASRALTPQDYQFYVSDDMYYEGRIIIPFWHAGRLTYFQARSLDDTIISPRYINPHQVDKDKIIFNYDELINGPTVEPLFVSEGAIDAISIGKRGIALNGSTVSDWQMAELKKVARRGRKLIFIIDKHENGYNLGMKVLKEGWHVTVLPDGVDDANKGRVRFGKLWLLNHVTSTAVTDLAGRLLLASKCEKKKAHEPRKTATPS
jgi:hypothetical protein